MKLLQVVWNFPPTVMKPFDMYYFYWPVREAVLRGWEAEVLTFQVDDKQSAEEIIDGIRVRRCPAGRRAGRPFSWSFIRALLTTDADIISCHGYGEGRSELAILLGYLRRRKVIFVPHMHFYPYRRILREWYDRTLGRFFFERSARVVVFTDYTYQRMVALGVKKEKIGIIPHVARSEVFTQGITWEPGTLLRQAGVSGSPLLLGVGQLIERKGWEYTVRCLPAVIKHFPEATFLIIGASKPAEPAFLEHLMQLASDMDVQDHIVIMQDNPPEFIIDAYLSATLVTHPSSVESFGLVLLEAMAAGKPVVAHNGTGIPCIIEHGVTGYVVDVHDVPSYTEALLTLLHDPIYREWMGKNGRRQAETRFSQAQIAEKLFALFEEVHIG
jgi:glycosyltransferase involved in cell wall biosynthesis